jgi:hypothetical protein
MNIVAAVIVCTLIWSDTVYGAGTDYHFIKINETEKRDLAAKAKMLKQGDSVERVLEILGTPYSDDLMMRKENDEVIGRSLKYYAVKMDKDLVNEKHDQLVTVYLDPDNKVDVITVRINLE